MATPKGGIAFAVLLEGSMLVATIALFLTLMVGEVELVDVTLEEVASVKVEYIGFAACKCMPLCIVYLLSHENCGC